MKIAKFMMPLGIMLAVVLAISASPVMAQLPVTSPFSGDVTIDGDPAPDGSGVAAYVGDEIEPRGTTTTSDGKYEIGLIGEAGDVGEAVSFKVKKAGTEEWLDATTMPEAPTYANYDPQVVNLSAFTTAPPPTPTIAFSPETFSFSATEGGANPEAQTLQIWNSGEEDSILDWEVSDDALWLSLSPTSGNSTGSGDVSEVTVSVDITDMAANDYSATITISAEDATNSPQSVSVSLAISSAPITVTWNCPRSYAVLISPYPNHDRPLLSVAVDLSEVTCDADWFQVFWLDEETGVYLYFISGSPGASTLTQLEPGEFYLVVVSAPCDLTIPQ